MLAKLARNTFATFKARVRVGVGNKEKKVHQPFMINKKPNEPNNEE